jgi:hypothetical protein
MREVFSFVYYGEWIKQNYSKLILAKLLLIFIVTYNLKLIIQILSFLAFKVYNVRIRL